MITIREALPRDVDSLLTIAKELHAKSPRARIHFDDDGARELFAKCIGQKRFAAFVATVSEVPVGLVIGAVQRWPYLKGTFVADLVFFASHPGAGRKLLKRLVQWGREQRVHEAIVSVSYGAKSARAEAIFARAGFEYRGGMFAMNLRN